VSPAALNLGAGLRWGGLAALLWAAAFGADLRTPFELRIGGGTASWTVAGSTVDGEIGPEAVLRLIVAVPASLPPGTSLEARVDTATEEHRIRCRLPQRAPSTGRALVGDWWVDSAARPAPVAEVALAGGDEVTVRGTIRGRWLEAIRLELHGPDVVVTARRGHINNDISLQALDGATVATTSIDPHPPARLAAAAATLLRAAALAALLIGLWRAFSRRPPQRDVERSKAPVVVVAAAAVIASGASLWMASTVLERMPHQPDEVVYGLQAGWIADGRLTGDVPMCPDHFEVPFTHHLGDRWIGHYPVGWPALLALADPLDASWAVAPLLRLPWILALAAVGWALDGRRTAVLAAALGATSPLATVLFSTRMAHPAAATAIVVALWLLLRPPDGVPLPRWRAPVAGLALAMAFAVRPLSAVAGAVVLGGALITDAVRGRRPARELASVVAGGLLGTLPTLVANAVVTGSPWHFPYALAGAPMMGGDQIAFGVRNLDAILAALDVQLLGWGWPWLTGPAAAGLAFAPAMLPFLLGRSRPGDRLLLTVAAGLVLVHVGARASGLHGYGPRYAFEALAPILVLSARGLAELAAFERDRRLPVALAAAATLIVGAAITTPLRAGLYRGYNHVDGALRRAAEDLEPCSIGLLPEDDWRVWAEVAPWLPPDPTGGPLFATGRPDDPELAWCFPDHQPLVWTDAGFVPNESLSIP
jgi:hypothetical protein